MDIEDLEPNEPKKTAKACQLGQDLAKLSVGELAALIETLKAEIVRVETQLAVKQSSKSAAESIFKR